MGPEELNKQYKWEAVHKPSHYNQGSIQAIDAFRAMVTPEEFHGAMRFNVHKYLWRYKDKGGVEDLKKAKVYLTWLINSLNNEDLEATK